jgi:hypothetical protein
MGLALWVVRGFNNFCNYIGKVQEELNGVTKQRDSYYQQLRELKTKLIFKEHEWKVSEHELDQTNKQLRNYSSPFKPLGASELFQLAQELYYCPSNYVDAINIIRKGILESQNMRNNSNPN